MLNKEDIIKVLGGVVVGSLATGLILSKLKTSNQQQNKKQPKKQQDYANPHYQQLKNEQLARIIKFFGQQKFKKLQKAYVVIFGVGGVGSHVVNMLARSGVGRIKIVDFDRVSLSSLNRHSFACRQDVGSSKVHCIKNYIKKILPHIKIEIEETYVTIQNAAKLLDESFDYVIDCIDNLDAKVELITICKQKNLKLIVSGGAGMKADPTRLQIRDIADAKYDTLMARIKKQLNKKGIKSGVKVAFSYQQTEKQLLPLNQQQQKNPQSFKVFDNYRIRIIPVLGTMPAILGMTIASYVMCQLAQQPYKPFQTDYVKNTQLNRLYTQLIHDEKRRGVPLNMMQIDMEEVAILAKEVYQYKCLVTDRKEHNPRLLRWNPQKTATIDNLAYISKQYYQKHVKFVNFQQVKQTYSQEIFQKFQQKSKQAERLWKSGFKVFT